MTVEELAQQVYELSFAAGMNQQYFQTMTDTWSNRDLWIRMGVTFVALVSLIVTAVGEFQKTRKARSEEEPTPSSSWQRFYSWCRFYSWSLWFSAASALMATVLSIYPAAETAQRHAMLYREWTAIRHQSDELLFDLDSQNSDQNNQETVAACDNARYRRLLALRAQVESQEPNPDMVLVEKCNKAEHRRRGTKTPEEDGTKTALHKNSPKQ